MKLKDIIPKLDITIEYELKNSREFENLALISENNVNKICSFIENIKYLQEIPGNVVSLIVTREIAELIKNDAIELCITSNPRLLFFQIHNYLSTQPYYLREDYPTSIGANCKISSLASISKNNVTIGEGVTIEEFVSIKENVTIGDHSIIRAGTVVGGQGFEFKRLQDSILSVLHTGGVVIGNNVEIQNNTTIDKGVYPWDNTIIGNYTKIDNLVHIGHAAKIGKNVLIVAHAGIGGRTIIMDGAWIGFGSIIKNGLIVGQNARANMGAIVTKDICDGQSVTGNFAINHHEFIKYQKTRVKNEF